jgi:23S rRNA pseudouridine2605 synthase
MDSPIEIRLNRFLAQCGVGSRRKADELILTGNVFVNEVKVTELGMKVRPGVDKVEYHGKVVKQVHAHEYLAYFKPRNVVVTKFDPEGRDTVYDALKKNGYELEHLNYVGRLDYGSEGLLLLTNDGDLIHALTHPRFQVKKVYRVKIDQQLSSEEINKLIDGIESEGQVLHAGAVRDVTVPSPDRVQYWYEIDLFEGKNRQIRRMFEALNIQVGRLRRIQFGSVKLEEMVAGEIRQLSEREILSLKNTGFKNSR